ncbi:MAG: response regulator transcription factor [Anaerolineales bacterium]|nr:response regulator transcription factor [Anaerolineales bacterium]
MNDSAIIRVLIADDHSVVSDGLTLGLEKQDDFEVLGSTRSGLATLQKVRELRPDLLLLDLNMPDLDGFHVLSELGRTTYKPFVLVLTSYHNPDYLIRAMALGADGYLSKDVDLATLIDALRRVARGEKAIDPLIPAAYEEDVQRSQERGETLTVQERHILRLLAEGKRNDDISEELSISGNTLKTHLRHIYRKLNVEDRTQAAVWVWRHRLLDDD